MQFIGGGAYAICGGRCLSGSAPGASHVGADSSPVAVSRRVRPPIDPFEYRWRRGAQPGRGMNSRSPVAQDATVLSHRNGRTLVPVCIHVA